MKLLLLTVIIFILPSTVYSIGNSLGIKYQTDLNMVPTAVGILGISLIVAHIVAPETYSWTKNTISELASQNYNYAWIMRTGFIGFGSFISGAATWDLISGRKHWAQSVPLIIYGSSLALTGFFSAAPFEEGVPFSIKEDKIHSIFANVAGIALTGAMLGSAIIEQNPKMRIAHISGMAFVVLASAMFKISPEYQGIWQRVLWTGSIAWLTVGFSF